MTKKTQRKQQKPAKPRPKQFVAALGDVRANMMQLAVGRTIDAAIKAGEHQARAELVAPIIEYMVDTANNSDGRETILGAYAARIILACLAEAGYVPAPQGGEEFAFPQSSSGVPGDDAQEKGCNATAPVAEAA